MKWLIGALFLAATVLVGVALNELLAIPMDVAWIEGFARIITAIVLVILWAVCAALLVEKEAGP